MNFKGLLSIIAIIMLISCSYKKLKSVSNKLPDREPNENGEIVIYNPKDYWKYRSKKIKIIDTVCPYKTKQAIADIRNGKLSIHFIYLNFTKRFIGKSERKQMEKLLSDYRISIDSAMEDFGCDRISGFAEFCYQHVMKKEIEKRYGLKFIDSLKGVVEKEYAIKHQDEIYDMQNCDDKSIYPDKKAFKDFFVEFDEQFARDFVYPKGYKYKNEQSFSYTDMDFIIEKNGNISSLKVESTFQNIENEKYKAYFENYVRNQILKARWTPATSSGIVVRSNFRNVVFHK